MVIYQNLKYFNVEMIFVIISVSRTVIPDFVVYCWSIQLNFLIRDEWNLNFLWRWKWHQSRIIIGKMDSLILYPLEESACETFTAAIQDCPQLTLTSELYSSTVSPAWLWNWCLCAVLVLLLLLVLLSWLSLWYEASRRTSRLLNLLNSVSAPYTVGGHCNIWSGEEKNSCSPLLFVPLSIFLEPCSEFKFCSLQVSQISSC